jgi:hypothetical protein
MLVLCNHQHDLDTAATIIQMQLQGPWNRPIYSAGSRRMFEPGFMAVRIPWMRSYLRRVDATKMFTLLGILPIENELYTRSLASLAWWVYCSHDEVPLRDVFPPEILARLDPHAATTTVGALFGKRWFKPAQSMRVSTRALLEPYRSEIMALTRAHLEPDYHRLEVTLQDGNTMFLTPEGRYSGDGRMNRLRSALMRLLPVAEQFYLLAVSYDPFVGRRLSCLFRIIAPQDPNDIESSMQAPRPVTVSHLLGAWIFENDRTSFTRDQAITGVRNRLESLPSGTFIDPELRKDATHMTLAALKGLARLGTLEARSNELHVTEQRRHPQFPIVSDMLGYQSRFLQETISALERLASRRSTAGR